MINSDNITVERASTERDEAGEHEYRIMRGNACLRRIYATDPRAAERAYWQAQVDHYRAEVERMTPTSALPAIGAALRADGVARIEGAGIDTMPYIEAARAMGYQARTHTIDGQRYLFVALDEKGLNKLKSKLDMGRLSDCLHD